MTRFAVGKSIVTKEPAIVVDAGLKVGVHRFQLVVATADGRKSAPVMAVVSVSEVVVPGPVLTPIATPVLTPFPSPGPVIATTPIRPPRPPRPPQPPRGVKPKSKRRSKP